MFFSSLNLNTHNQIEYLEDTDGTPTVELHVDMNTIAAVDMKCRGSK